MDISTERFQFPRVFLMFLRWKEKIPRRKFWKLLRSTICKKEVRATSNNLKTLLTSSCSTANGMSFEIAFQEEGEESIIKKHPPKRFQRLEEQQMSPKATLNKLQEKLDEADIRRQQV